MSVRIEEVDRLEDPVMGRAQHIDTQALDVIFRGEQFVFTTHPEREMLDPGGRVAIAVHFLLLRKFEERQDVAVPRIEEDVHIRVVFAGRRYVILREGGRVFHAQDTGIPLDRLLCVLAPIGRVMDAAELDRVIAHCAGSASSTPRFIWSRSMDSNSALKLPSPKPSSPLRWMNSKKTGPTCASAKICRRRRG